MHDITPSFIDQVPNTPRVGTVVPVGIYAECYDCQGDGSIELAPGTLWDRHIEHGPCPTCRGRGSILIGEEVDA